MGLVIGSRRPICSLASTQAPGDADVAHHFDPSNSLTMRGGSRVARWNATVPLATLTVDRSWLFLKTLGRPRPVWIGRDEIHAVTEVRGLMGSGVAFRASDGRYDGVIFWTLSLGDVMRTLASYGWPVEPKRRAS